MKDHVLSDQNPTPPKFHSNWQYLPSESMCECDNLVYKFYITENGFPKLMSVRISQYLTGNFDNKFLVEFFWLDLIIIV